MAIPNLANAAINLQAVRDVARKDLETLLKAVKGGDKALVLDTNISGPLGLIAEVDLLKSSGIEAIHRLLPGPLHTDRTNIIYLVRPNVNLMRIVADQIHAHRMEPRPRDRTYTIYFVPRKTMLCERVLEEKGVRGDVNVGEYQLELIPFDDDVLSLEMGEGFKECFADGNPTVLFYIARSLMKLQSAFGLIPNIKVKGTMALAVWRLMERMRKESNHNFAGSIPEIDSLILIDRQVDMITPMLTQFTYEGLIDELFGIKNGIVEVDSELIASADKDKKEKAPEKAPSGNPSKRPLCLNSNDDLFKEIRDFNFRVLGPHLHRKAEDVQSIYDRRGKIKSSSVSEMKAFMGELKEAHQEHNYLAIHINLAQEVSKLTRSRLFKQQVEIEAQILRGENLSECEDFVEALVFKMAPLAKVLRMFCLLVLTNGIKQKRLEQIKKAMVHTYGLDVVFTLANLERIGIFRHRKPPWQVARNPLQLYKPDVDPAASEKPKDISYTFNGYAPLSVRLIEMAHQPGWSKILGVLQELPGETLSTTQELPSAMQERMEYQHHPEVKAKAKEKDPKDAKAGAAAAAAAAADKEEKGPVGKKPLTLVYFIGGITFAEISALRMLREKESHGRDYLIATSKLINGAGLMETIFEQIPNAMKPAPDPTPAAPAPVGLARPPSAAAAAAAGAPTPKSVKPAKSKG